VEASFFSLRARQARVKKEKISMKIGISGVHRFIEKGAQFGYTRKECLDEKKSR